MTSSSQVMRFADAARLFFLCGFHLLRPLAPRNRCPLSFHRSGQKVIDLFQWIDAWKKVVEAHLEYAHEIQLLKIADVNQAAFDLRELATINIPTGKLQPHRQIGLTPTEAVSPSPDFRSNEILIQHAAARGISSIGRGFGICARLGAK